MAGGAAIGVSVGATGGTLFLPGVGTFGGGATLGLAGAVIGGAGGALVGTAVDVGYAIANSRLGSKIKGLILGGLIGGILGGKTTEEIDKGGPASTPRPVQEEVIRKPPVEVPDSTAGGGR